MMHLLINNRGNAKRNLKDYSEAIALDPDFAFAYLLRGLAKDELKDYDGGCADWKKAANHGGFAFTIIYRIVYL